MKKYYEIELFHWAGMLSDNIDQVKDILKEHPEYLTATNKIGDNCLLVAIQSGNINIVNYLIQDTNIDVNFQFTDNFDITGDNALMCSISNNKKEITEFILENTAIKIEATNSKGKNVYHLASFKGDADLIEKLMEIDGGKGLNTLDINNQHCLYDFIDNYLKSKDLWCLDLILENIDSKSLLSKNKDGLNIIEYIKKKMEDNPLVVRDYNPILYVITDKVNN